MGERKSLSLRRYQLQRKEESEEGKGDKEERSKYIFPFYRLRKLRHWEVKSTAWATRL